MSRLTLSLIAVALLSGTTPAMATDVNSAASIGANAFGNAASVYPRTRADERKWVLQRLEAICSSDLRSDQRRCDRAWRIIADGYAELQARRAADASAAAALPD
ncbi:MULTISPECIES: hypothetical protein [unclassified Sphingopyxis]|uniref:hypothetical protein n=1 Tax=unclassified Sphingopyxis TaxID=2614943 RepID=UPI002862D33B|nr:MULTISPECIES: hypothetical protein [unclassified Sphingopyxis]MDR6833761.1 hypothetical protein [Sphingopyxis sp. BE122]MDR7226030.1 hypothetical protein [Sphingopyxis sp. BE259]